MQKYDVIVLGTGGVGSACLLALARRGLRVLGIDQFALAHQLGSSHGQTRIIREAYFEHPDYVPLLKVAYQQWEELQAEHDQTVFQYQPLIESGPADGEVIPGILESAARYDLAVDELTPAEAQTLYPQFHFPENHVVVREQQAGILFVEKCVAAHIEAAQELQADYVSESRVTGWQASTGGVEITTTNGRHAAAALVITAGAWTGGLLNALGLPLNVQMKHLHWIDCPGADYDASAGSPSFLFECPNGIYYGFPKVDHRGVKMGEHSGGTLLATPDDVQRDVDPTDLQRVQGFRKHYLPQLTGTEREHCVCFYTMTPDGNFLVDQHPEHDNVVFAAGLSGHGFKFTNVLGTALADLVIDGQTALPIEFLGLQRFQN